MTTSQRDLLITLLQELGGRAGATDFQKLLFLYTKEYEQVPSYEFVPYRFGCFSFTAAADRQRLVERGLLDGSDDGWALTPAGRLHGGSLRQRGSVGRFAHRYGALRGHPLVAEVYRRYPYYATRSMIVDKVLCEDDKPAVEQAKPERKPAALATIGYEGRSLEDYLNTLLRDTVTVLCDVRANPLSRKYGFSKKTLARACDGVGIRYEHIPELGIASSERQGLSTQQDYDRLFAKYETETLPHVGSHLARIAAWVHEGGERVALTCYERLPCQCHRGRVADALERTSGCVLHPHHL